MTLCVLHLTLEKNYGLISFHKKTFPLLMTLNYCTCSQLAPTHCMSSVLIYVVYMLYICCIYVVYMLLICETLQTCSDKITCNRIPDKNVSDSNTLPYLINSKHEDALTYILYDCTGNEIRGAVCIPWLCGFFLYLFGSVSRCKRSLCRTSMIIFVYKECFSTFYTRSCHKKQTPRDATVRNNILNLDVNTCL